MPVAWPCASCQVTVPLPLRSATPRQLATAVLLISIRPEAMSVTAPLGEVQFSKRMTSCPLVCCGAASRSGGVRVMGWLGVVRAAQVSLAGAWLR